jgi:hypothetical protein
MQKTFTSSELGGANGLAMVTLKILLILVAAISTLLALKIYLPRRTRMAKDRDPTFVG